MDFDFDDMDMPEAPEWTPTPEEVAECAQWADMAEDNGVDFGFSEDEDDIETPKKQIENHLLTPETDVILRRAADELDLLPRNLEKFQSPIATGFSALDEKLNGGLRGLTIVGGLCAAGKTAFAQQIADFVAMSRPVLFFSLEMATEELICRSLSRIALMYAWHEGKKSAWGERFSPAQVHSKYSTVEILTNGLPPTEICRHYREKIAPNMYFVENARNVVKIKETAVNFIQTHHTRPFIIIDYLQILEEMDERKDRRKNIDLNVTALRCLVRETGCAILAISALNRENYKERISLAALKESGGLEYGADCVLGLQFARTGAKEFDFAKEAQRNPRELECAVLKSRTAQAFKTIPLKYCPAHNLFYSDDGETTFLR